jgi:dihydrodipicolinate synthase/N-acetylneuraminate lyase
VSGVAAAVPELITTLDRAISQEAFDRAAHLNDFVTEFLSWVNKFPATVAIKEAAVARGWKLGHASFPFDTTTNSEIEAFRTWFREWLPKVLQACTEPVATPHIQQSVG